MKIRGLLIKVTICDTECPFVVWTLDLINIILKSLQYNKTILTETYVWNS